VSVSQLQRAARCHDHESVKHACEVLAAMGLVRIQPHNRDPTIHVFITPLGKEVAVTLRDRVIFEHGRSVPRSTP
jgi:hypothetical protein